MIIPCVITIYADKSFSFEMKSPPASVLIKKAIGLEKGSKNALKEKVGTISRAKCAEIAKIKMKDLNANDIEAGASIIAGTARSMGIVVEG